MTVNTADLARVIQASDQPQAAAGEFRRAAVFALLTQRQQTHLLLIRRADRGDPWSNHMAFPGGHIDPSDASPLEAAYRETFEEIGIERQAITCLAELGHFQTHEFKVDVHAFVGLWNAQGPLRVNSAEVARVIEAPLDALWQQHHRNHFAAHSASRLGERLVYRWADETVWGVTARAIHHLLTVMTPLYEAAVDARVQDSRFKALQGQ